MVIRLGEFWKISPAKPVYGITAAYQPQLNFPMKRTFLSLITLALASNSLLAEKKYDAVKRGEKVFESLGCVVCHDTEAMEASAKTGPNLFGLFLKQPQDIEVMVAESQQKHSRKANKDYFTDTIRNSMDELAISREGPLKGQAYQPIMPSFPKAVMSDTDMDSVFHYLRSRGPKGKAGPGKVMKSENETVNVDSLVQIQDEALVASRTRVIRAGVEGLSTRAIHVGNPNGIHYSFDPRFLSVRRIWSGGFLNLKEERRGRAGQPSALGHAAKVLVDNQPLLTPLTANGEVVDFEFKEPDFLDIPAIEKYVWETTDFSDRLSSLDAEFLGYNIDPTTGTPSFNFRVGKNVFSQTLTLSKKGEVLITLSGTIQEKQEFKVSGTGLKTITANGGSIKDMTLTLMPKDESQVITLSSSLKQEVTASLPAGVEEITKSQQLVVEPAKAGKKPIQLPPGYSLKTWNSPKDIYGLPQLFESTGIDIAKDGTIVVSTRTAGIWRIRDGQWSLFAEGTFESLGVVIEDDKGDQIVISQKPELTRITDTDGDGRADHFEVVCDDFGIHGNYHEYMHGPVRDAEGNYYFNLNLAHAPRNKRASWLGGSACMGSMGGYRGWAMKVTPDNEMIPYAYGLRSPAGIGIDPNGRLWYAENQGDYVGSSKLVPLEEGKFYGHVAGLEALPGMTPESPELEPELWADKLRKGAVWFPQRKLANSPGNPTWDTTDGKFSQFPGQMFIGDQTLSRLIRVVTEQVDGIDQGCAIPFASGFASGIMRPVFLPNGSLLLGQTGRGWGAVGGNQEALQQLIWDGSTKAADIEKVSGDPKGFTLHLTQPLGPQVGESDLMKNITVNSWFYTNTGKYGSPEHDSREDALGSITISADRKMITLQPTNFGEGMWTDRVYHITMKPEAGKFDAEPANEKLEAYFTLRAIAK